MKTLPSLLLAAVSFTAGAVLAHDWHGAPPARPTPASREAPPAPPAPAAPGGVRDPKADLEGQMMWDPNTRTYQGG
jgi:hypothetical protein